jgi:hypothetical protein
VAFLLVYVDDIVLIDNNHNLQHGLVLTQTSYIYTILDRANMLDIKPINTPMATGASLSKFNGEAFEDLPLYRSIVGVLQYATITRTKISFAVHQVSQFMHALTSHY